MRDPGATIAAGILTPLLPEIIDIDVDDHLPCWLCVRSGPPTSISPPGRELSDLRLVLELLGGDDEEQRYRRRSILSPRRYWIAKPVERF